MRAQRGGAVGGGKKASRAASAPRGNGARQTAAAAATRRRLQRDSDDPAGDSDEEEEDEEEEEKEEEEEEVPARGMPPPRCVWTLRGTLAGRLARDNQHHGREYDVDAPANVVAAGAEAESAWLNAFFRTFAPAPSSPGDRRVSGLIAPKRRRLSGKKEAPNKTGRAGLDESAGAVITSTVYPWVRTKFFTPEDHLRTRVYAALKELEFVCSDAELEAWWEQKGHTLTLQKLKSARHSLVDAVKAAVWLAHGAAAGELALLAAFLSRHSGHKGAPHAGPGRQRQEAQGV
jgi:hypothetical protein